MADIPLQSRSLHNDEPPDKDLYDTENAAIPPSPRLNDKDHDYVAPLATYAPSPCAGRSRSSRFGSRFNGSYAVSVGSMTGGIVCAVVIAAIHHAFGMHFQGRPVRNSNDLWARYVVQLS